MKKFFTLIVAVASVMTAFAGNTLENADFAQGVLGEINVATYAKDGEVNHHQEVPGWTIAAEQEDGKAAGVMAYGSNTSLGGTAYKAPAVGPEGTNGNCLGMVGVWEFNVCYSQDVTLAAGSYTMTVPVYNGAGTTAFVKNRIGVKYGETEKFATATLYPVGQWTTEVIKFELAEETTVTVSLGYDGANVGSGGSQHLFIDKVTIEADAQPDEYTVNAKVTVDNQSKTFVGQVLKVVEKDGVATVTLPAAKAGPYTMAEQKVKVSVDAEGNISQIEGQTLNFKQGTNDIVVTVTEVYGKVVDEKIEVFVIAKGDNGKDVNVIYSTDEIKDITTINVDFTQFGDGVDATGADAIDAKEGVFSFVGNNGKVTLTKSGFYTGGSSSATTRYITVTPTFSGTLTVEGTASGDNTDRYIFVATAPGADETAENVLKSVAIPEKGVRHSLDVNLEAGTTYYVCLHGNGTVTALSYTNEPTAAPAVEAAPAKAVKVIKYIKDGQVIIGNVNAAAQQMF